MSSKTSCGIDDRCHSLTWPAIGTPGDQTSEYNGPREGSWIVSSSAGSWIDDECPTVLGYPRACAGSRNVKPLDASLIAKLQQSALHRNAEATAESKKTPEQHEPSREEATTDKSIMPRVFRVPPLPTSGAKQYAPLMTSPFVKTLVKEAQKPETMKTTRKSPQRIRRAPSPVVQSVEQANAAASQAQSSNTIRILGKNGEEAFVSLPNVLTYSIAASEKSRYGSKPSHHTSSERRPCRVNATSESAGIREHDFAGLLMVEDEKRDVSMAPESHQFGSHAASSAKMYIYKPATARSARTLVSTKSPPKLSEAEALHFPNSFSAPSRHDSHVESHKSRSGRRSRTITPIVHTIEHGSELRPTVPIYQVSIEEHSSLASAPRSQRRSERSPVSDVQEAKVDDTWLGRSKPESRSVQSPMDSKGGRQSSGRSTHLHIDIPVEDSRQEATIFAGAGWISPHPLSSVPSRAQSVVSLPLSGHDRGKRMTYKEWQQLRHVTCSSGSDRSTYELLNRQGIIDREHQPLQQDDDSLTGYMSGRVASWHLYDVKGPKVPKSGSVQSRASHQSYIQHAAPQSPQEDQRSQRSSRHSHGQGQSEDLTAPSTSASSTIARVATVLSSSANGSRRVYAPEKQLVHLKLPWDR